MVSYFIDFFYLLAYNLRMYLLVIKQLFIMFLIAACGFFVSRQFKFGALEQQFVSKVLIYFVNPSLVFFKFDMDFDAESLRNFGIVFLLSVIIHFVMVALALVFCRSRRAEEKELDQIDRLSVVFTNCSFIGIPLIDGIFPGTNAIFYLLPFIVTFNIFLWTFGYRTFGGRVNFKKLLLNPNIIAVVAGFILFCSPFRLPEVISEPFRHISGMNTAMAMFLLGMLFADFHGFKKTYTMHLVKLCVLRFAVVLIFVFLIILAASRVFAGVPDIRLICYVTYIAALCPVAMSVSSFAVLFDKDESYSGLGVLATSLLCVVTLPLGVALAEFFF